MNKIIITAVISLILGIAITITGYSVYVVVQIQKQTNINTATISEIVKFLNQANTPKTETK
jgi:hypothetical protein